MEPTYAHTCVKGIKLAAGELSDSTEEEEVEAMAAEEEAAKDEFYMANGFTAFAFFDSCHRF